MIFAITPEKPEITYVIGSRGVMIHHPDGRNAFYRKDEIYFDELIGQLRDALPTRPRQLTLQEDLQEIYKALAHLAKYGMRMPY